MTDVKVKISEGTFAVSDSGGHGTPVLLLHSLGGSKRLWKRVSQLLGPGYRTIAPDYLGHGESSRPPREATIMDHATWMVELLDQLGVDKFAVVGTSLGGQVATEIASRYSHRVLATVMNGAAGWHLEAQRTSRLATISRLFGPDGLPLPDASIGGTVVECEPEEEAERRADLQRAGRWALSTMWAIVSYDPIARLPKIESPTLLLYGDKDYHAATSYTIADSLSDATLEFIHDCGHLTPYDAPEATAHAIEKFLNERVRHEG